MIKLFNYLLNRDPTPEEINKYSKNTFQEINKFILGMGEYKEILKKTDKEISIIIKKNLDNIKLHKIILFEITDIYKNNKYQAKYVIKYINLKKFEIKNIVDTYLQKYFKIRNNLNYDEFYKIFFNNNFDYKRLEFYIVNSNLFLNLTENKLNDFYKKNKF